MKCNDMAIPSSVPQEPESAFKERFVNPTATIFTLPTGYESRCEVRDAELPLQRPGLLSGTYNPVRKNINPQNVLLLPGVRSKVCRAHISQLESGE
jgi:hypothetical protein